ncbi:hypothetical protein [Emticicia sp. 17c]|uniref:hypothetical protein n=1 Tax=Emticicia sp. 17c TaxID=3127704 RepID=UPI00301B707D
MEDTELIALWKNYDKKLGENLRLNRKNAEDITQIKVRSFLKSMQPIKIFAIIIGIVWVGFIDMVVLASYQAGNYFLFGSALVQTVLTKLAIGVYVYQLVLIHQANINDAVLVTQEKIARLKSSTIWVARLLFLQLPVWTTFYWTSAMITQNGWLFYAIQLPVTGAFVYAAIWLFFNIRYEHRDKKWFKLIFNGIEWEPVMQSIALLNQIEGYKTSSTQVAGHESEF